MRYYQITISDPVTKKVLVPNTTSRVFTPTDPGAGVWTYCSLAPGATPATRGGTLAGALRVEIDAPVAPTAVPVGGTRVRVWGVSLQEIGQQAQLAGMDIVVQGGVAAGLPLAKPQQAGVLFSGQVFQAFGEWSGTEMALELVVTPKWGTQDVPVNLSGVWKKGSPVSQILASAFSAAFPDLKQDINVTDLVVGEDQPFAYKTLAAFAQYIKRITQTLGGGDYMGVDIYLDNSVVRAYDQFAQPPTVQIAFEDMVGQPTWIDTATVNTRFVMRSDITVGGYIQFPQGLAAPYVLTAPPAAAPNAPSRNKAAFQGTFYVTEVHHFGDSRQPTADAWVTMVNAVSAPKQAEKTGVVTIEDVPG